MTPILLTEELIQNKKARLSLRFIVILRLK